MKAKRAITIALAATVATCALSVGRVFAADDGLTDYPQHFECTLTFETPLRDFAVYGDIYAFAYNTMITVLSKESNGEIKRTDFMHDSEISRLDYGDDGKLYYQNTSGVTYLYGNKDPIQYTFGENVSTAPDYAPLILSKSVYYSLSKEGTLDYHANGNVQTVDDGEGFTLVKKCGDGVYAIKNDRPYSVDSVNITPVPLEYTDFSDADKVSVGDFGTALQTLGATVTTAKIDGGVYYTQVDADSVEDKFKQVITKKTNGPKPCLVLAESDGASLIATTDGMFITSPDNVHDRSTHLSAVNDWQQNADGERIAYAIETVGVYAYPFMCESTKIATMQSGADHPVKVLEKYTFDFLKSEFYKVSYEDGDKTVVGFVAPEYLTAFSFAVDDHRPEESGDAEFDYDTNVPSVVIAIVIVALVIIAIMYLSMISHKKNGNKTKKDKDNKDSKEKKKTKQPPAEEVADPEEEE